MNSKHQHQQNTYKCDLSNIEFKGRLDFMKHRKIEHRQAVTICRYALYGTCMFGYDNCWFVHETEHVFQIENIF